MVMFLTFATVMAAVVMFITVPQTLCDCAMASFIAVAVLMFITVCVNIYYRCYGVASLGTARRLSRGGRSCGVYGQSQRRALHLVQGTETATRIATTHMNVVPRE